MSLDDAAQATAEVNAQLQRDFSTLEPVIGNVVRREFGDARISVGLLSLTRSVTRPGEVLPDTYTQVQTAAVYSSSTLRFPRFDLGPESIAFKLVEKAAQLVLRVGNFGKVDFTSHPEFSRRYRVQALDNEATRWLLDDRVLGRLAGTTGLSISAANGSLILYRAGEELSPGSLEAFFTEAADVFRAFEAAARRPGAFNDPMRPRPTDAELFVEKTAAAFGTKLLPGITLADAEAFLRSPPPRVISPAIARYCKEQGFPLAFHFGGVFVMGSVIFLIAGQNQLQWYAQIPLYLLFAGGVSMAIWTFATRLRIRHLLQHGKAGTARIEEIRSSVSRVDGATKYNLALQIESGGTTHPASCPVPDNAIARLQAITAEKKTIPVIYSARNPARVLVADALVMEQGVG